MWSVEALRSLERARNLGRDRRLILASLISAVLIISTIFVGIFPLTAQSGSSVGFNGSSGSFQIYIESGMMLNQWANGPIDYNGTLTTKLTIGVAKMSNMTLVKENPDGRKFEIKAKSVSAKNLTLYTTSVDLWVYQNGRKYVHLFFTGDMTLNNFPLPNGTFAEIYITAVYQNASYLSMTPWERELVETAYDVGQYSSLALDSSDNPHISYYHKKTAIMTQDLNYARWNGTAWVIDTVDSGGDVGQYSSIAIDSSDNPHISYYDATNGHLKYVRWDGTNWIGWNGTDWIIGPQPVDSDDDVGQYSSLALDSSDNPHISYYDNSSKDLKYAKWDGTWVIDTVDSGGDVGQYSSIAIDKSNDYPHISYYDATNGHLKYVRWDGTDWITPQIVDSAGDVGQYSSIAIDSSDNPHISYYDNSSKDLKYAKWDGTWVIDTVDSGGDVGQYSSIAIDSSDNPHISYYNATGGDLKYAVRNCGDWSTYIVDSAYDSGQYSSIAIDKSNDYPHISYYYVYLFSGGTDHYLKYAKLTETGLLLTVT